MSGGTTGTFYGGGVLLDTYAVFTKNGGTITGYASDTVNGNVVRVTMSGTTYVLPANGHAVYTLIGGVSSINHFRKETTADPATNLSFDGTASPATKSGDWDN